MSQPPPNLFAREAPGPWQLAAALALVAAAGCMGGCDDAAGLEVDAGVPGDGGDPADARPLADAGDRADATVLRDGGHDAGADGGPVDAGLDVRDTYYASVTGNPDHDGRSEATAWSLGHAFANLPDGARLWVRAGNYGAQALELNATGVHVIGYRDVIEDVMSATYSTQRVEDPLDPSAMPYIDVGDPAASPAAITNRGADNIIENFTITNGNRGIVNTDTAGGTTYRNIILSEMGSDGSANDNTQPYEGFGLVSHSRVTVENSIFKNIGAHACQAYGANASGSRFHHNDLFSGDFLQATDYGFLVNGATDREAPPITDVDVSYNRIVRVDGLWHGMHGIDFKYNVERSTAHHNEILGTSIEFSMPGSQFNVAEHNRIVGYGSGPGSWHAHVLFYNGARNNTVRNNVIQSCWNAVTFVSNGEDLIDYGSISNTGFDDNTIENNIVRDVGSFLYSNVSLDGGNALGPREIRSLAVRNNTVIDARGFMSWEFRLVNPAFENNALDNVPVQASMSDDLATNNTHGSMVGESLVNNVYFGEHNAFYDVGFTMTSDPLWVDRAAFPAGLRPEAGSPLIDPAVSSGNDLDAEGSPARGNRDIGAYEHTAP
ncbi:MAG: hypothetical protein AB8I08_06395 [Sandaracinaceae bacterium]